METKQSVWMYYNSGSQDSGRNLDVHFHPNYVFRKYNLLWNFNRTNSCINAKGNYEFGNVDYRTDRPHDFYVGSGTPEEAQQEIAANVLASSLVNKKGGYVLSGGQRYTYQNEWTVLDGAVFTEYERSASVNKPQLGKIRVAGLEGTELSWKHITSVSIKLPESGYSRDAPVAEAANGSTFYGWWVDGEKVEYPLNLATDMTDIVAVFGVPFTVSYVANGPNQTTADSSFVYGLDDYVPQGNIAENPFTWNSRSFVGWNTAADGSGISIPPDSSASFVYETVGASAGQTIVLYAQWVRIKMYKSGTGTDASENVNAVGSLYVLSSEDGYDYDSRIQPREINDTVDGVQTKAWLFAPKPNTTYRVGCTMQSGEPDKFWSFSGLKDTQGNSYTEIQVGATLSNIVLNATFTRKPTKTVSTDERAEAGSIRPEEMTATLAITTPQTPDVLDSQTPPYTSGVYIAGQRIAATAQYPAGMTGWTLKTALLEIGQSQTEIPNFVNDNAVIIPPDVFSGDMNIIGIFGRIDCTVHAEADAPSATAVSGVSVRRYDHDEDEWVDARGEAKHGETVRIYAELDIAGGYHFDGIYANGQKITHTFADDEHLEPVEIDYSGQLPYSEQYQEGGVTKTRHYINCRVAGNSEFVVKAKVRLSLSVGHWDVSGNTWIDDPETPCTVTARIGETEVTAGGFDVVLGQAVSYGVNVEQGWHFDAWFAWDGETKPTAFDDPSALPAEDAAFVPTKPLALLARVTDEIVSYTTTIGFVNNDNPALPVEIEQEDTENVASYPAADGADVDSGKVKLTYSSGTKTVALTFRETIGALYFEGLQEYVRTGFEQHDWAPAEIEGTVHRMLTSKTRTLRVLYTTSGTRTVTVAYANTTDGAGQPVEPGTEARVCGSIEIVKTVDAGTLSPDGKTYEADRGTPFTLRAIPLNGWRFVGWYYEPTHIGVPKYEGQEASPPSGIISTRTLYAYFAPDTHAIYEWEGRSENKMMRWRSKVYVSTVPFNPSAIRVDAADALGRGTSVALVEVGMMSSPDATPQPNATTTLTNMPNYAARRLPKRRPERYLQVEVRNDAEIDRIVVGTSMEELRA